MDNNLTLRLGGDEKTLVFGNIGFLRHVGQLTKDTGFNVLKAAFENDPLTSAQCAYYFIHAGLLAGNHKDLNAEQVQAWVDELPIEKLSEIQWAGYSGITGKPVDELKRLAEENAKKNGMEKALMT